MVTLKPIKLLPARERVASALRKAIISKQIGEGEVITLEATAQQLGVSVTPVREAFQILARDGLIDLKQNKGATVLGLNETTIREHYEIRAALESAACVLCCQRKADLSAIRNCLEMADEALEKKDSSSYSNYNQSFHYEIWTAAVLIPVVIGIAAKSGYSRSRLLMPLVFAAAMGGNLSLIGAPGNMIAQSALSEIGLGFGFFEYAIVGLPILICGALFYTTLGMKLLPDRQPKDDGAFDTTADYSNVPAWKQKLSLVILLLTLLAMIFEKKIGIKLYVSGCMGALALIITGVISEKQALNSIDLKTIFLFGGTLSLAAALEKTGAGEMVAEKVMHLLGENPSPYVLTFAVFMLCCIMTNFMSNTATTALLVPICVSIAQGMGADPRAVLMACVIGGSCAYATPIGMPANTMVLGAGGYTFLDYTKSGLPLIVIATIVSMIILPIAFPFFP